MNKKKLVALLVAGIMTLGVVGGTFAWFTSEDSLVNSFSTSGGNNNDPEAGIKIVEDWESDDAQNITPGTIVNKDVQVKSEVEYDQFIRVKLIKNFYKVNNGQKHKVEPDANNGLDYDYIKLNFTNKLNNNEDGNLAVDNGQWILVGDYYYYIGKVGANSHTNTLLDSVTLSDEAGNQYKDIEFDVIVEADAIQASNGAYADGWAPDALKNKYSSLEADENPTLPNDTLIQ